MFFCTARGDLCIVNVTYDSDVLPLSQCRCAPFKKFTGDRKLSTRGSQPWSLQLILVTKPVLLIQCKPLDLHFCGEIQNPETLSVNEKQALSVVL